MFKRNRVSKKKHSRDRNSRFIPMLDPLEARRLLTTVIYDDGLAGDWQNWSWDATVDVASNNPVRQGSSAISATIDQGWGGLFLGSNNPIDIDSTDHLTFSIHGGVGGQEINFQVYDQYDELQSLETLTLSPGWIDVTIELEATNIQKISGLIWQDVSGAPAPTFHVDELVIGRPTDDDSPVTPDSPAATEPADVVYSDTLHEPWQNWSWGTEADFAASQQLNSGTNSIAVTHSEAWSGLYLGTPEVVSISDLDQFQFSANGGTGGQTIAVSFVDEQQQWSEAITINLPTDTWRTYTIELNSIAAPQQLSGVVFQEFNGAPQDAYYVDDIAFLRETENASSTPTEPGLGPSISVVPSTIIRQISDDIYGLNFADGELAADIGLPVNRWGGNATSRYNYEIDAFNTASDWFFENHPSDVSNSPELEFDTSSDQFVEQNSRQGAETIMTVGTVGWTAKGREIVGGFDANVYGPQQQVDPYRTQYGNGVRLDGTYITGNDPTDTSVAVDEAFAQQFVEHLVATHGTAEQGGVQYYALGNEPMLWNSTHRDVHPEPASYDEVLQIGIDYAEAIKRADPTAEVLGPTVWGWTAYFYSALDGAADGAWWLEPQDRNAHGGEAFLPWYLGEMAAAEQQTGERLLDYLDIHYYPQTQGVALTDGPGSIATQEARLRSTRSLWDPEYVDESWIGESVQLIPRMRDWIDNNYPDTKLAITEYNFGAVEDINGAVVQADVLGIFGREGVDLATMWGPPDADDPAGYAFRMFRNYDGRGDVDSRFGEFSVAASSDDSDSVSVFAATREADDALTVMLINKTTDELTTPLALPEDYDGVAAEVYRYDAANLDQIVRLNDIETDDAISVTLPGYSITLLEFPSPELQASGASANVLSVDRIGSMLSLDSLSVTFNESPLGVVTLTLEGEQFVDLSGVIPTWNAAGDQATWDVSALNITPDQYQLTVDGPDVNAFQQELLITWGGDVTLDLKVDVGDFLILSSNFGKQNAEWTDGDFTGDGEIDFADFLVFIENFGRRV